MTTSISEMSSLFQPEETTTMQKHVESVTSVVLIVEEEKLHVIKEVSTGRQNVTQYSDLNLTLLKCC